MLSWHTWYDLNIVKHHSQSESCCHFKAAAAQVSPNEYYQQVYAPYHKV